jgi:hypothetical protein
VVGCELDETTGNVTSTVEVTSERGYSTVLVDFELVDARGTVVASTSTSASNVRPRETYRLGCPSRRPASSARASPAKPTST